MAASEKVAAMRAHLLAGQVIPAHPLALTEQRKLDERHQRALTRYYIDAGAGGIAVGVHTTQFAIRRPEHSLYQPVLELAADTARASLSSDLASRPFTLVAGVIGDTRQAVGEAEIAAALGYHLALLGLGSLQHASEPELISHCRAVGEVLPLFGFYLQPAVGGRVLSYDFWREFAGIKNAWAIKIAPFNRYQTLDVVRAVADAGRQDIALYTGNDDSIIVDLLTPFPVAAGGAAAARHIVGGLLGQWAVWTREAVNLLDRVRSARGRILGSEWLRDAAALTDANGVIFDARHAFAGCIPGIHEVLRCQGLLRGTWCLDPAEQLSAGQSEEISRIRDAYPELSDDSFVLENLHRWLA
jgi:dihydrodipicolinate synthase/N-acetylneuraminate lyase